MMTIRLSTNIRTTTYINTYVPTTYKLQHWKQLASIDTYHNHISNNANNSRHRNTDVNTNALERKQQQYEMSTQISRKVTTLVHRDRAISVICDCHGGPHKSRHFGDKALQCYITYRNFASDCDFELRCPSLNSVLAAGSLDLTRAMPNR